MSILIGILLTLHVAVCLLLVLIVLMQRPRSEGLGAAFGGGVTENIFGAQTTNVLSKFTVWLGVAFFALTLLLAMAYSHLESGETAVEKGVMSAPVPVATPTPASTPAAVTPVVPAATATPDAAATPAPTVVPTEASPTPAATTAP